MSFQMVKNEQTFERHSRVISNAGNPQQKLKVLIPYDGSETTEAALEDLRKAGLPQSLNVVVAVTDMWLPLSPYELSRAVSARRMRVLSAGASSFVPALRDYEEQLALSVEAERRISAMFPSGTIKAEVMRDTAAIANEILRKAKQWTVELIVVGSRISPSPQINDYAGPAAKVARDAHCSVRIAREQAAAPVIRNASPRVIIAIDGSGPAMVVQTVMERDWPPGSEIRLVTVRTSGPHDPEREAGTTLMLDHAAEELREKGLTVSIVTRDGKPEDALLQEAHEFAADCIFIRSGGFSRMLERSHDGRGLSKTAEALVLGAPCSVEIVRAKQLGDDYLKPAA